MHHADVIVAAAAADTQRALMMMMAMTMLMKMKIVVVVIGGVIVVIGLVSQKYLHFKTNSLSLPLSSSHSPTPCILQLLLLVSHGCNGGVDDETPHCWATFGKQ